MAVKAADGTHHHSASRARFHDEMMAEKSKKPDGEKPPVGKETMHAHSHKGGAHDVSETPIHEVVKKHGPATHVFSEHDHEAEKHHVHTVHGEKHHHSDHETSEDAHEHMGNALGHGMENEDEEQDGAEPYGGEETEEEEEAEGHAIPGLS